MSAGNKHLGYKNALNEIEAGSPGAKHSFYFGFLDRAAEFFAAEASIDREGLGACASCGAPTTSETCAFCRLVERAGGQLPERTGVNAVSVDLGPTRSGSIQ